MTLPRDPDLPDHERRRESRCSVNLPAQLVDSSESALSQVISTELLDISKNGMRVRVWHDAPVGTRFCLSIQHEEDTSLCITEVIWKRETTLGMIYGLRVIHWTYIAPALKHEFERKLIGSNLKMDVQNVPIAGDVVLPLHPDLALGAKSRFGSGLN